MDEGYHRAAAAAVPDPIAPAVHDAVPAVAPVHGGPVVVEEEGGRDAEEVQAAARLRRGCGEGPISLDGLQGCSRQLVELRVGGTRRLRKVRCGRGR